MSASISFIIPCFNPRIDFLSECIRSIKSQLESSDEIIIIDDGSNNNEDIKKVATQYGIKQLISLKKNTGVSSARNKGIEIAKNHWVTFIDSDDVVIDGSIKSIKKELTESENNIEILTCSVMLSEKKRNIVFQIANSEQAIKDLKVETISIRTSKANKPKPAGIVAGKIYNIDFLRRNNIHFESSVKRAEDHIFFLDCLSKNPTIKKTKILFYKIRKNPESVTQKYDKDLSRKLDKTIFQLEKRINKDDADEMNAFRARKGDYVLLTILNEYKKHAISKKNKRNTAVREILDDSLNREALIFYKNNLSSKLKKIYIDLLLNGRYRTAYLLYGIKKAA